MQVVSGGNVFVVKKVFLGILVIIMCFGGVVIASPEVFASNPISEPTVLTMTGLVLISFAGFIRKMFY